MDDIRTQASAESAIRPKEYREFLRKHGIE